MPPSRRHLRMHSRGLRTRDRFTFHFQVDGRIAIRGIDTGMTQPVTDESREMLGIMDHLRYNGLD
jgi:hypothetical protein